MSEDDKKNKDERSEGAQQELGIPVVETIGRDFRVEGNDVRGYIGVDSEYRTYADDTHKPFITDADVEVLERSGQLTDVETMSTQVAAQKRRERGADEVGDTVTKEADASTSSSPEAEAASDKNSDPAPKVGAVNADAEKGKTAQTVAATKDAATKTR